MRVASEPEAQDHRRWHFAGHTLTGAELLAQIEAAAGRLGWTPARGWRHGGMPWGLIRLAGRVWPMGRELAEMAYLWERPHALDGRAMAQAFGPLPATPIDQALRQTQLALGFDHEPGGAAARRQHILPSIALTMNHPTPLPRRSFLRVIGGGSIAAALPLGLAACSSGMPPEAIAAWQRKNG